MTIIIIIDTITIIIIIIIINTSDTDLTTKQLHHELSLHGAQAGQLAPVPAHKMLWSY